MLAPLIAISPFLTAFYRKFAELGSSVRCFLA
jgi:hypothetical protein